MLEDFFLSKKTTDTAKVRVIQPFGLSTEKIAEDPRSFKTDNVKEAINNIVIDFNTESTSNLCANYIMKDLFFQMHQSGLYNRQLKLWKTIGHITNIKLITIEKGLFKKQDSGLKMIDFLIDSDKPYFRAFINNSKNDVKTLKKHIQLCLDFQSMKNLRGIFYFMKVENNSFISNLENYLKTNDDMTKYEAKIPMTNDIRLNIISHEGDFCSFKQIFPTIKPKEKATVKKL